jgi:hypothetical protein
MTAIGDRSTPDLSSSGTPARPGPTRWGLTVGLAAVAVAVGLLLPDATARKGAGDGAMTHYMGLLAANQPWNLLLFMAVPVILAETLAITELALLFKPDAPAVVRSLNRWSGLVAGVWFTGIVVYLLTNAAIPLTASGGWRGAGDLLAVGAYLLGIVPLGGISLIELGVLGTGSARDRVKLHAVFVGIFLVVAHVAMIFGMLDPSLLGWHAAPADTMPGMSM